MIVVVLLIFNNNSCIGYGRQCWLLCLNSCRSREVYHTKRMQHVVCVKWSADNKYVMSGSDEMNIRLWKANAAEKLGVVSPDIFTFSRHPIDCSAIHLHDTGELQCSVFIRGCQTHLWNYFFCGGCFQYCIVTWADVLSRVRHFEISNESIREPSHVVQ